jgi:hypothetical protein
VKAPIRPSITEHSASSGASKWHQANGMQPGDTLIEECEEVDGVLIRKATRIERDSVVIRRTVEEQRPPLPAENADNQLGSRPVRPDPTGP